MSKLYDIYLEKKEKDSSKLYLYKNNMLDIRFVRMSINSFKAHIKHVNSYNLYSKYMDKIIFKNKISGNGLKAIVNY